MISVTVQRNDQSFRNRWRWHSTATRWASEVGEAMADAVRAEAPVGKKNSGNGRLRDSISYKPTISATTASVEVTSRAPHAGYVINGTPPHVIEPRTATILHWEEGGNHFYRHRVYHPGTRPNPFPERALRGKVSSIQGRLKNAVATTLEGV